jgi:hypothetical protein
MRICKRTVQPDKYATEEANIVQQCNLFIDLYLNLIIFHYRYNDSSTSTTLVQKKQQQQVHFEVQNSKMYPILVDSEEF